jgi:hypothetical protein
MTLLSFGPIARGDINPSYLRCRLSSASTPSNPSTPSSPSPPPPQRRMEVDRTATAAAAGGSSSSCVMAVDQAAGGVEKPRFDALMPSEMSGGRPQYRKVPVPQHRFAPLKRCWMEIYNPVYEHMKVDIRMNLKVRN